MSWIIVKNAQYVKLQVSKLALSEFEEEEEPPLPNLLVAQKDVLGEVDPDCTTLWNMMGE